MPIKLTKEFIIINAETMQRARMPSGHSIPPLFTSYEAANIILELENSEQYQIVEVQGFKKYD